MSKKNLYMQDFKLCSLDDNSYKYFSYQGNGFEIMIEPNSNGFDVSSYDHNGILIDKRLPVKTRLNEMPHDLFKRAFRVANALHRKIVGSNYEPELIDVVLR